MRRENAVAVAGNAKAGGLTEREIQAILTLLSDEDQEVVRAVRKKLADMSQETVVGIHAAAGSHVRAQQEIAKLLVRMDDPPPGQTIRGPIPLLRNRP